MIITPKVSWVGPPIERSTVLFNRRRAELIKEAISKYGRIYPCGIKTNLLDCFTIDDGPIIDTKYICLWFNIEPNGSTTKAVTIAVTSDYEKLYG